MTEAPAVDARHLFMPGEGSAPMGVCNECAGYGRRVTVQWAGKERILCLGCARSPRRP